MLLIEGNPALIEIQDVEKNAFLIVSPRFLTFKRASQTEN